MEEGLQLYTGVGVAGLGVEVEVGWLAEGLIVCVLAYIYV